MTLSRLMTGARWCQLTLPNLRAGLRTQNTLKSKELWPTPRYTTQTRSHTVETKSLIEQNYAVEKDTLLFRNENRRFFKLINLFAMSQFFFWSYLSHFALTMMKDVEVPADVRDDPNIPWWRKMNLGKYRNGITVSCFMIGWGTMALSWMYTLRSVRYLVLKKGGKSLAFVTFTPFGRNKTLNVPLEKVSAKQSRLTATVHLPLKVKGKYFHYILDMRGQFPNAKLFDYSAGLRRNWAQ
ncbi:transmembrane protein 223-like [Penaeus japonicus]|uniref:transmembrane protein 223-like n=1 Tax=Penaeus japonicus TaxID=27405 RepID=UPI001C70B3DF|nr:transmembrane protein 223-like [Penaeus japonicus]